MSDSQLTTGVVTGVRRDGDAVTIGLAGQFDLSCAESLYRSGVAQLRPGVRSLTLDMEQVTLLDSVCTWSLMRLHRAAVEQGVSVRLVVRHRIVVLVVELAGLAQHMSITTAA